MRKTPRVRKVRFKSQLRIMGIRGGIKPVILDNRRDNCHIGAIMLSKDSVTSQLSGFFPLLRDIVLDGFNDYVRDYASVSYKHHARSRASLIHDHIAHYAKGRLLSHPSFHHIPTRVRNLFDFSGKVVLQFKKLSRCLRTHNIQTQLTLDFNGQRAVYCLPGISPTLPRLTIGYVPNAFWSAIDGVFLVYSMGKTLVWYEDLTQFGQQTETFEPLVADGQPAQSPKRIRAKAPRRKHGGDSAASL